MDASTFLLGQNNLEHVYYIVFNKTLVAHSGYCFLHAKFIAQLTAVFSVTIQINLFVDFWGNQNLDGHLLYLE